MTDEVNHCLCHRIGGSEESVMGIKPTWSVEWKSFSGTITLEKVKAYDIHGALSAFEKGKRYGFDDDRFILGIRKD